MLNVLRSVGQFGSIGRVPPATSPRRKRPTLGVAPSLLPDLRSIASRLSFGPENVEPGARLDVDPLRGGDFGLARPLAAGEEREPGRWTASCVSTISFASESMSASAVLPFSVAFTKLLPGFQLSGDRCLNLEFVIHCHVPGIPRCGMSGT